MESTKNRKPSKDRGIVRIDQPEKYNHGWWVRRRRGTKMYSKFFADKKNGGKNKARLAAREFNEELTDKLPPVSRRRSASKTSPLFQKAQRLTRSTRRMAVAR